MADVDTRVETLEDELKVLKGEVRRTLVDLRALLMREDSPLNEKSFARRTGLVDGDEEASLVKKEVSDVVRQEASAPVRAPEPNPLPQTPPDVGTGIAAPGLSAPAPFAAPPPVVPQVQNPMWAAVAGNPPGPPPPGPAFDPAIGERERKLAEQERRMEEQERRLADQERRMADAGRLKSAPVRVANTDRDDDEEPAVDVRQRVGAGVGVGVGVGAGRKSMRREEEWVGDLEEGNESNTVEIQAARPEEAGEEILRATRAPTSNRPADAGTGDDDDDRYNKPGEDGRPAGHGEKRSRARDDDKAGIKQPSKPTAGPEKRYQLNVTEDRDEEVPKTGAPRRREDRPKVGRSNGAASVYEEDEHEELVPSGVTRNGHSSRVYEEYLDLLGEKPELDAAADENEDSFPLDVNLLSSLTRWTSVAKHRVGEQRLNEMLDLYNQSGHLSVSLRELLLKISAMVDEVPQESRQDPQGCVDLIFHLHGILAGGLPIR